MCIHVCLYSWDESSSISSGLSDGSDNLSSEEFNTSPVLNSLPTTPIGSRRNSGVVVSDFNLSYKVYTEIHPNTACCMKSNRKRVLGNEPIQRTETRNWKLYEHGQKTKSYFYSSFSENYIIAFHFQVEIYFRTFILVHKIVLNDGQNKTSPMKSEQNQPFPHARATSEVLV